MIATFHGKIVKIEKEPGMHFWISPHTNRHTINQAQKVTTINGSSVPDENGNPLNVSATINYIIGDPVAYLFNIYDTHNFMQNQARDVLRRVCGAFPFRSNDPNKASLSEDSSIISKHMKELL